MIKLNRLALPLVAFSFAMSSCGGGENKDGESANETTEMTPIEYPTPILDRDLFFGNPEIAGGQLSPDGQYISFLKEYEGIMNIWVKRFDQPFEEAYPLTNSERPLSGYFWTEDGKYILYVKDKDGDENMNIFSVDPSQKAEEGVPASRNLTPFEDVTARISHVSDNDPDMMMVSINDRDKAWHDLYKLTISTGSLEKLYENTDRVTSYGFDWDDNLRLLYKTDEQGNTVIMRKDADGLTPIYDFSVTEGAGAVAWNEDNSKIYFMTNKGDLNLTTLYLMDPMTGEMELIESDPENKVDLTNVIMNKNTRKMVYTAYTDDKTRRYFKDPEREALYAYLEEQFPGREVGFSSATNDYSKFLVSVSGDKYASESYFFNAETKELIHQYTPRPDLKEVEEHLSEMTPVTYPSSDGMMIPAYLSTPAGVEAKNLPTVIMVHGGPKGPRDYWGYHPYVQFLTNRGYAVLQPNFRASGGYGKKFLNAGDLEWGKLMQDDVTWGVNYLVENGIADKNRVAIMGGSYGGYATLAGLAFTPDVYACGVDIVGPSNIFTLLESVPAYWEAGRAFLYGMVGDPETEEGRKRIEEASPLFSADKISKPLLVIQGANDPRVKKAEADQIVVALRDKGQKVDYILADDEGHGFRKPVNNMAMFAAIEKFLAETIGGRYQEDMPEDVATRLEEMTVDINTVVYSEKGAATYSTEMPAVTSPFEEGTSKLTVTIELQGQSIPMDVTRTISKDGDNWIVQDNASSQMGEMQDVATYNSEYRIIKRAMEQMGTNMVINYSDNVASVDVAGKITEIDFEGIALDQAPGAEQIIAHMDLQEGNPLIVSSIDMSSMKAKTLSISYVGEDNRDDVTCNKYEVVDYYNEVEKQEFWTSKEGNALVYAEQIVPAMNNAKVTTVPVK